MESRKPLSSLPSISRFRMAEPGPVECGERNGEESQADPGKPPLRVGLLIDSFEQPAWTARIIEEVQLCKSATLSLVVKNEAEGEVRPPGPEKRIRLWKQFLYRAYSRFDSWKFPLQRDACRKTDVQVLLAGVPVLKLVPRQVQSWDYFPDEDVDAILRYRLDVALSLGFRSLRGRALSIARYGVWAHLGGDGQAHHLGGPAGLWEVLEGSPVTESVLQVLSEDPNQGRVLHRSFVPTDALSVRRNQNKSLWKSAPLMVRKLNELHRQGWESLSREGGRPYPLDSTSAGFLPSNRELAPGLLRMARRYAGGKLQEVFYTEQWMVLYKFHPAAAGALFRFSRLVPPPDRFWADPFPVVREGRFYIFLEEGSKESGRAHISVLEIDPQGNCSQPVPVLKSSTHLSYPFVFEWRGHLYMIPENQESRTVRLYRCVCFPYQWREEAVLLSGFRAVDATLFQAGSRWYLFTSIAEEGLPNCHELFLFCAGSPTGPWRPHPRNPVKSDARSSRPAGRLFYRRGELYRPAQDCSQRYGGAISVNRITRLDETAFEEEEVAKIRPDWAPDLVATHTLNSVPGLTVIDAKRKRRRLGLPR